MCSEDQQEKRSWFDFIKFRKLDLTGKILLILSILFFGTVLILIFFSIALHRWNTLGVYSIWGFFGWVFFVVLFYVSGKLISMFMHRTKAEQQEVNNQHTLNNK